MPLYLSEGRSVDFDSHGYLMQTYHTLNAIPNHNGIEQVVTMRALSLYRIMIQLTTEAYANNATAPAIMERPSIAV